MAEAAAARPLARSGEAIAFEEAMLHASHRLFDNAEAQEHRTQIFLEKFLAVARWGGDVEGFLANWRVRHLAPHQDSGMLADVIEFQHEGKKEDYIVRYITDRYEPDDD